MNEQIEDPVQVSAQALHQLYRENAQLRIFVEDLTHPDRFGHVVKHYAPEIFKRAVQLKKEWKK